MSEYSLRAISPVDGRYYNSTSELSSYFSEYALIRYRLHVEIEYFIALCQLPLPELKGFPAKQFGKLRNLYTRFTIKDALRIKEIEKITNHDVKSVEYFLKEVFEKNKWNKFSEFIHFGLTSQDINNTAIPLGMLDCTFRTYLPLLFNIRHSLRQKARDWKDIPMLARTHGQPASPTLLGKELMVFVERLDNQLQLLTKIPLQAKFGGATGNLNAHYAAYPEIDWLGFADKFASLLGLERQQYTTQIEHYDNLAATFDNMKRINSILIDFCKDIWLYISMDYFKLKVVGHEVGSSTMPHKINPIDFENAEGNLGMANAVFEYLSTKLPVSRLQRDLTDSTVTRNIGVPIAHTMIAFRAIEKGMSKITINRLKLDDDLENNWVIVSEALQTILRKAGYEKPYELVKGITRTNEKLNKESLHKFIDQLEVTREVKVKMKKISPFNYTGKMKEISDENLKCK